MAADGLRVDLFANGRVVHNRWALALCFDAQQHASGKNGGWRDRHFLNMCVISTPLSGMKGASWLSRSSSTCVQQRTSVASI